jgi:hypothetical protein
VLLSLGLAAALAGPARAVAPSGTYHFEFGGPQSIWVLEGGVDCEPDIGCFDLPVVCDPRGSCTGSGELLGLAGGIRAKLRGNDRTGVTRVTLAFRFEGVFAEGPLLGVEARVTGTQKGQIDASGASSLLTRAKACLVGLGCETVRESGSFDVAPGEGDWELDLDVVNVDGTTLAGSAVASITDEIAYDYTVTGRYDARKDLSSLVLVPDAGSEGSSIRFRNVRVVPGGLLGEIRYKILGHSGRTAVSASTFSSFPGISGVGFSAIWLPFLPVGTSGP